MNNINSSLLQLSLNERVNSTNIYGSRNIDTNVAVDFKTYNFENSKLTLSRNADKLIPEYLILNLQDNNITLETIHNYAQNMYINLKIGTQTLLNIPLSILWNLKEPEIFDDKLYLQIPFEMFFGNIHIFGLQFWEVSFNIINHTNLANYVSSYSLLCKTYIGDSRYRRNSIDTSNCCIQQISSLEVKVSLDNPENVSNEFKIITNMFPGFSKGFLIESSNINELNYIQFYINDLIRISYNKFMIRNKCQRVNDTLIFLPFNPDISYSERSFNSFIGSIHLSEAQSYLKLNFDTPRNVVKIYSINMNDYSQRSSEIRSSQNIVNTHLVQDFTTHSLTHNESIETNVIYNNIQVNSIIENDQNIIENDQNIIYNNYTYTNLYSGMSGPNYYIDPSGMSGMSGMSGPSNTSSVNIDNLIVNSGICRLIPEDKKICGISLDEIRENQNYMCCTHCHNNFNENDIRIWLRSRRTCPNCRGIWSDYNIYINSLSLVLNVNVPY